MDDFPTETASLDTLHENAIRAVFIRHTKGKDELPSSDVLNVFQKQHWQCDKYAVEAALCILGYPKFLTLEDFSRLKRLTANSMERRCNNSYGTSLELNMAELLRSAKSYKPVISRRSQQSSLNNSDEYSAADYDNKDIESLLLRQVQPIAYREIQRRREYLTDATRRSSKALLNKRIALLREQLRTAVQNSDDICFQRLIEKTGKFGIGISLASSGNHQNISHLLTSKPNKERSDTKSLSKPSKERLDTISLATISGIVNMQYNSGLTLLHEACIICNSNIVQLLIENKAITTKVDEKGNSPLHALCYCYESEISREQRVANRRKSILKIQQMRLRYIQPSINDVFEYWCEYHKKQRRKIAEESILSSLFSNGSKWNEETDDGETVLYLAAKAKRNNLVKRICLECERNNDHINEMINPKEYRNKLNNMTALQYAAFKNDSETLKTLIHLGYNIEAIYKRQKKSFECEHILDGFTPLILCASAGFSKCCRELIKANANIDAIDVKQRNPLHWSLLNGHKETSKILICAGASTDTIDVYGSTPYDLTNSLNKGDEFRSAAATNSIVDMKALLKVGALSDNKWGESALHWAADNNSISATRFLIDLGAKVDIDDMDKKKPLHWACSAQHYDIVQLLLEAGANAIVEDRYGMSPLLSVCFAPFRSLREANSNANGYKVIELLTSDNWLGRDELERHNIHTGLAPIHFAALKGNSRAIQILLESGVSTDLRTSKNDSRTALIIAVVEGHGQCVAVLLQSGADVDVRDSMGRTALHWAHYTAKEDMAMLLLESGADMEILDQSGRVAVQLTLEGFRQKVK